MNVAIDLLQIVDQRLACRHSNSQGCNIGNGFRQSVAREQDFSPDFSLQPYVPDHEQPFEASTRP